MTGLFLNSNGFRSKGSSVDGMAQSAITAEVWPQADNATLGLVTGTSIYPISGS